MAKKMDKRIGTIAGATQRLINVAFPPEPHNTTACWIQLDKMLSGLNRRLYRQGRVYRVTVTANATGDPTQVLNVYTIANTWQFRKAYHLARKMYDRSHQDELEAGVKRARWLDFRVKPSPTGVGNIGATAIRYSSNALSTGSPNIDEYTVSSVNKTDGQEREFHVMGDTTGSSWGILYEYDRIGDADVGIENIQPGTGPYYDLFDDLQYQEASTMTGDANAPPYDADRLQSSEHMVRNAVLKATASGTYRQSVTVDAPLGLIYIDTTGVDHLLQTGYSLDVQVHAGDYKGVHAPSLLQGA
jgi:hypothetical protein